MILLLLLLLLFRNERPITNINNNVPFFGRRFFLFRFIQLRLHLLPFPRFLLLFANRRRFKMFLRPIPFYRNNDFLLVNFLSSNVLHNCNFLSYDSFFFYRSISTFRLPILIFMFHPSFLNNNVCFNACFKMSAYANRLFRGVQFFTFLTLRRLNRITLHRRNNTTRLFRNRPRYDLCFYLCPVLFIRLYTTFLIFRYPTRVLRNS